MVTAENNPVLSSMVEELELEVEDLKREVEDMKHKLGFEVES